MFRWIVLLLAAFPCFGNELTVFDWLPGIAWPPRLEFALPEEYCVGSIDPRREPHVAELVLWGAPGAMQQLQQHSGNRLPRLDQEVFAVTISQNVAQIDHSHFTDEDVFVAGDEWAGMRVISQEKLFWGPHPVLTMEVAVEGRPMFVAWVGLNYATSVLRVCMYVPEDPLLAVAARHRWETFLQGTRAYPHHHSCKK